MIKQHYIIVNHYCVFPDTDVFLILGSDQSRANLYAFLTFMHINIISIMKENKQFLLNDGKDLLSTYHVSCVRHWAKWFTWYYDLLFKEPVSFLLRNNLPEVAHYQYSITLGIICTEFLFLYRVCMFFHLFKQSWGFMVCQPWFWSNAAILRILSYFFDSSLWGN